MQAGLVSAVVGGAFAQSAQAKHDHDIGPRLLVTAPAATAPPLRPPSGLIVIALHDIEPHPHTVHAITPAQFSGLLQDLAAAGFAPASTRDVLDVVAGRRLTAAKALITFDDGTKGLWTYADSALRKYGWRATAFVITGRVSTHQPYYLTWPELAEMQGSGRWDLQSHTHLGHDRVPSSPYGETGPFLSTVRWDDNRKEFESISAWQRSVDQDLAQSQTDFVVHGLPRPQLFAYPFSARGLPSNDPRVPHLLPLAVKRHFIAAFTNDAVAGYVDGAQARQRLIYRVELDRTLTRTSFAARLRSLVRGKPSLDPERDLRAVKRT